MAATSNTIRDLPPADLSRLGKLAGMLGSDFDGERATAAALASNLLKNHGLTWADVFRVPDPASSYGRRGCWIDPESPQEALRVLHDYADVLLDRNEWLANFVADLHARTPARISLKQQRKIKEALNIVQAHAETTGDFR